MPTTYDSFEVKDVDFLLTEDDGTGPAYSLVLKKNDGTYFTVVLGAGNNFIPKTLITGKGDLIAGSSASVAARVGVGANGQVLTADSTAAAGVSWQDPTGPSTINATWKAAVRAVLTSSVSVATPGALVADGVTLVANDRILLTGNGSGNGVYVFNGSGSALTRATDANTSALMPTYTSIPVSEGTLYKDTVWRLTTNAPIVLGTTSLVFSPNLRSPGTGTSSYAAGQTALASGTGSTAVAVSSEASGAQSTALGASSTASGAQSTSIGESSQATFISSVAVGRVAQATNTQTTALGTGAKALSTQAVAVGAGAIVDLTENGGVAMGYLARCGGGPTTSGDSVAIGREAWAANWRDTCVGYKAQAWNVSGTALGRGSISAGVHCTAIGRGGWTPYGVDGQIAIGVASGPMDFWINSGHANKYWDPIAGAGNEQILRDPTACPITIHGYDGYDAGGWIVTDGVLNSTTTITSATGWSFGHVGARVEGTGIPAGATIVSLANFDGSGSLFHTAILSTAAVSTASGVTLTTTFYPSGWTQTNNTPGGDLILMAGRSTGTAAGGKAKLSVSPAGTVSNNVKNSTVDVVIAGVSGTNAALAFFGGAVASKWTSLPADATDLATAIALVNDIKNNVIKRHSMAA